MVDSSWKVCHASSSLQYALPDEAAREQQAIVVAEEGDCLVIATADPTEPATDQELKASATHASPDESLDQPLEHPPGRARSTIAGERRAELSAITGRPVQLVTASHAEIEIALARSRGGATTQALRWDRFGFLVRDCGLGYLLAEHEQKPQSGPDDQATDRVAAAAAELPDGWGPELLGLLEGMPHMSERDAPFDPALCVLLPPEVRAGWGTFPIVPRGLEDGYLVLGCDRMPDEKILRAVTGWTGFQVRCILCETALLRLVIDTFKSLASGKGRNGKPTGHFEWVRETARTGLKVIPFRFAQLSAAENRQTHAVSYQAGLRRDLAAMPLPSVIQVNNSRTPSLNPDPAALAAIPSQLARSLEILPLKMDQHGVVFGIAEDRPEAQQIRRAVGSLIGKNIRFRVSNGHYLREALSKHCRQTHALQPVQASWRGHRQKRSAPAHVHVPGQRREMGNLAAERRGFVPTQYLPSIRLEHYAIQPEVIKLIPLETLESHCAVPLRREGHVLWVALGEPSEKAVHELAQGAGLTIRPLAASPEAVRARLRLCRVSAHALTTYQSHPVIAYLQQQGRLHETNLLQILDTPGTAVDQALDAAGILDYDEFAVLAAQLCALPQINLRVSYTPESRSMLSGSRALSAVLQDLVDPLVASNMAPNEARALGIVPLRRELMGRAGNPIDAPELPEDASDSCLVVAVADPWSPLIAATLSEPAYGAHRLVVAPRPDIIATIARAHGRAQLGERLLLSGVVSQQDLDRAVQLHQYTGVRIGQALIHLNLISEDQLAYFLSEQLDLPFVGLQAMKPDIELARCLPEHVERRLGILPLYEKGNVIIAVSPDPLNAAALAEAEKRTGRPIQLMICTEGEFEAALEVLYRDLYLATSSSDLATRSPEESAERVITRSQVLTISIIALVALVLLWRVPLQFGVGLAAGCTVIYASFSLYRGYLIYRALSHDLEVPVSAEELAELDESTLPIYTVLVPLYREAAVLPTLIAGLARLDYPKTKLDVKLLLEEDDRETLDVVAATQLPPYLHPVIVPAAKPRGKPKACNYGLIHAQGEFVVIFDAEDVPEPDQLKKAVLAFRKVPADVACLQAKLNYYNANQNLLTRWFAIEYSMWFDLFLPGLDASKAPVPLGGTSNHFRTAYLLEAGAWDPYNVTEDADLGIRLYRRGWKTAVIESTTYEEATSEVYNWIRQRSRWVKGYIQTYLVHMRHPVQLWRAIGGKAFFSFNMVVGGTFFGFLVNPILWCLTALWYLSHAHLIRDMFPGAVFYLSTCSLLLGNTVFIYLNVAGSMRPGMYDKVKYSFLSPLYWALMSVAAWKGFLQLWTNPFYWEKTQHGHYRTLAPAAPTPALASENPSPHAEVA